MHTINTCTYTQVAVSKPPGLQVLPRSMFNQRTVLTLLRHYWSDTRGPNAGAPPAPVHRLGRGTSGGLGGCGGHRRHHHHGAAPVLGRHPLPSLVAGSQACRPGSCPWHRLQWCPCLCLHLRAGLLLCGCSPAAKRALTEAMAKATAQPQAPAHDSSSNGSMAPPAAAVPAPADCTSVRKFYRALVQGQVAGEEVGGFSRHDARPAMVLLGSLCRGLPGDVAAAPMLLAVG